MQNSIENTINKYVDEFIEAFKRNMEEKNINASGRTINSLRKVNYNGGIQVIIGGDNTAPLATLEIGREAGSVPSNFSQIIEQWARDKGILINPIPYKRQNSENFQQKYTPEQRGMRNFVYFVTKKIKEQGTNRNKINEDVYSGELEILKNKINTISENLINQITRQNL